MQTNTNSSVWIIAVLSVLLATAPAVFAGPSEEAQQIASLADFHGGLAIHVGEAPVVSIPIALCLFLMMYPIMVKIDFAEVLRAGKSFRPVSLTLIANWAIKPFTMYAICLFFHGTPLPRGRHYPCI